MNTRIRHLLGTALATGGLLAITACGSSTTPDAQGTTTDAGPPVEGGQLSIVIPDSIDGWNPDSAVQVSTYQVLREVVSPLVDVSADGQKILPGLAKDWSYNDAGTALTMELQPGAAFSDGTPLTAEDVVFSVKQWMSGAQYGPLYSNFIKDAKAKGDDTVVIELTAPSSALLGILTWSNAAVVPADFGGKSAEEFYAEPVGAGPFAIASTSPDKIELVRNDHYWDADLPHLDGITYRVVADTSQRLLQVQSNDAQLADRVPIDNLSAAASDAQLLSVPSTSMSVVTFSQSAPVVEDLHFRKAVSLAIDRDALVTSVYENNAETAAGVLPPNVPGAEGCSTCDWATHDVDAAKAEVAQMEGDLETVEMLVDSSRGIDLLAAQAIQPMLAEAGIDIQIKQLDSATLLSRLATSDFSMAIGNYTSMAPTAVDPLSFFAATGYLFTGADPTIALAAIGAVSAATTVEDQTSAVADFEKQNYDTASVVPLLSPYVASVAGADLHGLALQPSGLYDAASLWLKN